MNLLLALLALLVALGLVTVTVRQVRRLQLRRAWRQLAPRLELSLTGGRRMSGRYRGSPFEVILSGASSQVRMRIQAELPPAFSLSRQQPETRRLKGVRDIQVGDKPLDDAVLIQAQNPAATIRLLRAPGVRDALLGLLTDHPQAVVLGNEVVVPLEKKPDEELGRRVLRSAQRLASAIEASAAPLQDQAREARELARLEAQALASQAPKPPRPPKSPQPEPSGLSPTAVRDAFAARLWTYRVLTYPAMFGGFFLVFITRFNPERWRLPPPWPADAWGALGFLLAILGITAQNLGGYFLLRCPACEGKLLTGYRSRSPQFETEVCPHCQTRLT
jgi:hypothetical protein